MKKIKACNMHVSVILDCRGRKVVRDEGMGWEVRRSEGEIKKETFKIYQNFTIK